MRKFFYPAERVCALIGRVKNNLRAKRRRPSALTGYTEFFFEIATDISDCLYRLFFLHSSIIKQPLFFVKHFFKNQKLILCIKYSKYAIFYTIMQFIHKIFIKELKIMHKKV